MRSAKVLMITVSEMRTDARISREAEALHRAGFDVEILCSLSVPPAVISGPRLTEIRPSPGPRGLRMVTLFLRLWWATVRRSADIYHAHNVHTLPMAATAAALRRGRVVYDAHELYALSATGESSQPPTLRQRLESWVERRLARRAGLRLTASTRYAQHISQALDIDPPIAVPNYPELPDDGCESPLRALIGARDTDIVVLYQGGFYLRSRALDVVVEAMRLLPPAYRLVFLGFGPNDEESLLRRQISDAGLGDRVNILPAVPHQELAAYTRGADIGVIPFRLTSAAMQLCSPNKLYEYMASGVAVVSSGADELSEVIRHTGSGAIYDYSDPTDLASTIQRLGSSRADLRGVGARGRRAAEQHYSWEAASISFVQTYQEFANGCRP